jgi:hypothetical protein
MTVWEQEPSDATTRLLVGRDALTSNIELGTVMGLILERLGVASAPPVQAAARAFCGSVLFAPRIQYRVNGWIVPGGWLRHFT